MVIVTYYQNKIKSIHNTQQNMVTLHDILQSIKTHKPNQLSTMNVISPKPQHLDTNLNDEELFYNYCYNMNFAGYKSLKKRIYRSVIQPWKRHLIHQYKQQKSMIQPPKGVIFHGPSGCGKSILSCILSSTLNFQLLQIKQTDILNKWLGSSERNIREIFQKARSSSPCIIFFDDIDSFTSSRNDYDDDEGGDNVYSRILSTLLNEMDGVEQQNVFIVATTNRLHAVDSALLRPGRIEEHVHVVKPDFDDVLDIMTMYTKEISLGHDVKLKDVVGHVFDSYEKGVTCADIEGICRETCFAAMRRLELRDRGDDDEEIFVEKIDFEEAINTVLSL